MLLPKPPPKPCKEWFVHYHDIPQTIIYDQKKLFHSQWGTAIASCSSLVLSCSPSHWNSRLDKMIEWPFFFFFYFTILYWICHTSTCICHGCTHVPHPEPPFHLPPHTTLWVIPVHQPWASYIMHRAWSGHLFHIWYYTCFSAILPNHPTLALSHRVQKTVLYICVSFAVSHTGLSLPSF